MPWSAWYRKIYNHKLMEVRSPKLVALAAWLLIVAATSWQIFGRPVLGISNNGDYSKVSGYYKLAPVVGWGVGESEFYVPDYEFADRHFYASALTSSEHVFAWPAVKLSRLLFGKQSFSLLMVGAVKLLWLWVAAWWVLWALARSGNWPGLLLATLWLADASTICYLPGFYMDSAALLFTISLAASLLWWGRGYSWAALPAVVSAVGVLMSKSQHAPLAFVFALAALVVAWRHRWVVAVALLFGLLGYGMLRETTSQYAAVPVFTLTFHRIAATGDRMGLDESYRKYEGMHAYSPGSPIEDRAWGEEFLKRVSLEKIARWYLTHPLATAGYLIEDWRRFAGVQPDAGLGWRRREDGFAARSQAGGLTVWKWLRPWGVVGVILAPVLAWRRRAFWGVGLCVVLCGVEFGVASLGDTLE
ncbi:MAG: hypothetical protein NTW74_17985, partial [Acidobacteria bacterium]|nr:hypothetical protein [Acidobacteriota bacterium]